MKKNTLALALIFSSAICCAGEYPIGHDTIQDEMDVRIRFIPPVHVEPATQTKPANQSDIHLEAIITATGNNHFGFHSGDWVPYLPVHYHLFKKYSHQTLDGQLTPMVSNDGPRYGANIHMDGPGRYHLRLDIDPPAHDAITIARHTDRETGVGDWFKSASLNYDFIYAGTGKKGGM